MKDYVKILRAVWLCMFIAICAVTASAQIDLRNIKIPINKRPEPKNPPPTTTSGNKTPPTTSTTRTPPVSNTYANAGNVNASGGGATREEVNAFTKDLHDFVRERMKSGPRGSGRALHALKNHFTGAGNANYAGCSPDVAQLRAMLDDGAAFAEIVKAKYANIENPTWTHDPDSMAGDWRRAVENRNDVVKSCVTAKFVAELNGKVKGLEKALANFKSERAGEWAGFVLSRNFDDLAGRHADLLEKYKDAYALVGVTMPDNSVFAPYDTAMNALVEEAKSRAGEWKWSWNFHDTVVETKIRSRFTPWDPKGRIVKIGLMHSDWQIDGPSGGVPRGRYKRAYVLYRKAGLQPCVLAVYSYEQTYAGGGRFTDSVTTGFSPTVRLQNCN